MILDLGVHTEIRYVLVILLGLITHELELVWWEPTLLLNNRIVVLLVLLDLDLGLRFFIDRFRFENIIQLLIQVLPVLRFEVSHFFLLFRVIHTVHITLGLYCVLLLGRVLFSGHRLLLFHVGHFVLDLAPNLLPLLHVEFFGLVLLLQF